MASTRIAVAGAGVIGRAHIAALQASACCALTAVVDPQPAAQAVARSAGVPWYATLDELLQRDRPEGVVLATPNPLHVPQALQCVQAGVAVLVEKPLATSVQEGQRLLDVWAGADMPVLVGHHRAHSPIMARAREVVQSGRLGPMVAVTGSAMFFKPHHYFDDGPWRREVGGGPILINLIHEVHNLRMLCGDIVAVQALASHAARGFAVEDSVAINLRFASGVLGSFMLSDTAACARSWEQTSRENPAYPSYDDEDCYVISGTRGSLSVPTMRVKRYLRDEDASWWKPFACEVVDLARDDPIRLQMEHFGAVARREAAPLVSAYDGLQNLRVTDAVAEAARTGTTVHLQ